MKKGKIHTVDVSYTVNNSRLYVDAWDFYNLIAGSLSETNKKRIREGFNRAKKKLGLK